VSTVTVYGPGGFDPTLPNNNIIEQYETPDPMPQPLDPTGALATLLAVVGTLTVDDAANAVGLTADDLVAEAQAWAMGDDVDPLQYNVI
jgi:hypothetical protein